MKLAQLVIPTEVMRTGMTVGDVFREWAERHVAGLPFVDVAGRVVGRISLRDTLERACIPPFVLEAAHVLGDELPNVNIPEIQVRSLLGRPVEEFVLECMAHLGSRSAVLKVLALMELHDTSYLFLIDDEIYPGVVTRMTVALRMLQLSPEQPIRAPDSPLKRR
jgi:hypothetical protein